jgi:hypothetical protein
LNVANNATFDLITDLLGECTGGKTSTKGNPMGLFPGMWPQLLALTQWLLFSA